MPATQFAQRQLSMSEIKTKAAALGITPGKMKKVELIHSIQSAERCTPCYGTSDGQCIHTDCCWRKDCLETAF